MCTWYMAYVVVDRGVTGVSRVCEQCVWPHQVRRGRKSSSSNCISTPTTRTATRTRRLAVRRRHICCWSSLLTDELIGLPCPILLNARAGQVGRNYIIFDWSKFGFSSICLYIGYWISCVHCSTQ